MVYPKRKAQYDFDRLDIKRSRQNPSIAYIQNYAGKHQKNRGGRVMTRKLHTHDQVSQQPSQPRQHLVAQTMQQVLGSPQQHGLPQVAQESQIEELEAEWQDDKLGLFAPYSEDKIPVLWSTNIDHSSSQVLQTEKFDSIALRHYYRAIAMTKTGLNREQLGIPPANAGYGSPVTIDYVDLYLDLSDGEVYVAASEQGLMTVPDYLKLSGIAVQRKLSFKGRSPGWATAVFDAAEKRYVTEFWEALHGTPLPVRSEVQILDTFEMPVEPVGMWANVYSAYVGKVIQFPLAYTTTDREFAMSSGRPCSLSAIELRHVLAVPEKEPSPHELAEALFAQAQECDRNTLDLQMAKTRDDYLKECGHLHGKYAPTNTQKKKGIFFESPPFTPCEDNGEFIVLVKGQGTKESFMVEWTKDWNASLQDAPKTHNVNGSKSGQARTVKAPSYTPYSRSSSAKRTEEMDNLSNVVNENEVDRARRLQELRQKLVAKSEKVIVKRSSASPSGQSSTASKEPPADTQAMQEVVSGSVSTESPDSSSRKRKQSGALKPPIKRVKMNDDEASGETEATHLIHLTPQK
ncbi:uncharacterized protein CC84DRAFT_1217598 [Paraphaeosphaeria sporulosa]|uniref:Uncharacterized protein n=1 Tax=Paraphaeosphaeria sporulosa TaxID=1460663 RepID=A0A177CGM3_9PLEO|nr:uncharacterized protein CC84DRAFT_1217598 [Paraphaeosphaeria sporulosa]OAG06371.1 hypothetical protein CC84DRAFT_1217598 [Paraphaeosphaeria sporulosa]